MSSFDVSCRINKELKYRVYIAGPYSTGDVMLNIRNAVEAANQVLRLGAIPYIPHLTGFWHLITPKPYEEWLEYDFEWLKQCHCVLRLPGESKGADREVELAKKLGIPVFYSLEDLARWLNT